MKLDNWKTDIISLDLVYHDDNTVTATLNSTIGDDKYPLIEDMTARDLDRLATLCVDRSLDIEEEEARLDREAAMKPTPLSESDRNK